MINYDYLRPLKGETMKAWSDHLIKKETGLHIEVYNDAIILPLKKMQGEDLLWGRGGVIKDGLFVESSAYPGRQGGFYQEEIKSYKDQKVVFCGYFAYHWGHFLMESTARLWYALKKDETIDRYVFMYKSNENCQILGNFREFLELLGIWDKVELICEPTQFREVVIPEISYLWDKHYSEEFKKVFQYVSSQALKKNFSKNKENKIYFSRSEFNKIKRSEVGLDFLDNFFIKNGFKILYPERMSLSELIVYIYNADICATVSGTLPHNLLFGQNGKKVIIVERQPWINEYQVNVDKIMNLNVDYIDANLFIYPVHMSAGPFFYSFNEYMQKFAIEKEYVVVDEKYKKERYLKRSIKEYISLFYEKYHYEWSLYEWLLSEKDILFEGYRDSYKTLGKYLSGQVPFQFDQYFEKKYIDKHTPQIIKNFFGSRIFKISFWKHILKRLLIKVKIMKN